MVGAYRMASACVGHAVKIENETDTAPVKLRSSGVERLPKEMNTMKIKDDKVITRFRLFERESSVTVFVFYHAKQFYSDMKANSGIKSIFLMGKFLQEMEEKATVVVGNVTEAGHIIATTIGGRNGEPKQVSHV